jgi:hypothetical protein
LEGPTRRVRRTWLASASWVNPPASEMASTSFTVEVDRIIVGVRREEQMCREHAAEIADKIRAQTSVRLDMLSLRLVHAGGGVMKALETQTNILVVPAP